MSSGLAGSTLRNFAALSRRSPATSPIPQARRLRGRRSASGTTPPGRSCPPGSSKRRIASTRPRPHSRAHGFGRSRPRSRGRPSRTAPQGRARGTPMPRATRERRPEALVPAVDAPSGDATESCGVIPLDFRVVESHDRRGVMASCGVVDPPHDLHVLLRHRPLSIPRLKRRLVVPEGRIAARGACPSRPRSGSGVCRSVRRRRRACPTRRGSSRPASICRAGSACS
jgi:hypothetical protein